MGKIKLHVYKEIQKRHTEIKRNKKRCNNSLLLVQCRGFCHLEGLHGRCKEGCRSYPNRALCLRGYWSKILGSYSHSLTAVSWKMLQASHGKTSILFWEQQPAGSHLEPDLQAKQSKGSVSWLVQLHVTEKQHCLKMDSSWAIQNYSTWHQIISGKL